MIRCYILIPCIGWIRLILPRGERSYSGIRGWEQLEINPDFFRTEKLGIPWEEK